MGMFGRRALRGALVAIPFVLAFAPAEAQQAGRASVSATAGAPNAVFVDVPNEPCIFLYGSLSDRITGLDLDFGPVKFDQRAYFLKYCREKTDDLVARIRAPFEAARDRAQEAVDQASSELTGGFWKFMAEQLYARLPPEEQARYAPGSPEVQALAHRWLNEAPEEEFGTYVAAYLTAGGQQSRLLNAWKAYVDLANGESRTILAGISRLLTDAKTRLDQILLARQRIAEEPDTPIADIMTEVGLSGAWFETFKSHEAEIRGLDSTYRLSEAMRIVSRAMGAEDQSEKVRTFFQLMGLSGDLLAETNQPLFAFVGQIIRDYANVANQALDNALALDGLIQQRNGFCLGEGVPSRDIRQVYFVERGILACPLSYGAWPLKHVYQSQGAGPTRYFFYDGSSFVEAENPSGQDGVIAASRLIADAIALGYPVVSDPDSHIARVAEVYNTTNPGGVPGLMANAREIVATIEAAAAAVDDLHRPGDACSVDQVLSAVARNAGFSSDSFLRDLANGGADRLASAIAASFIAFEGRFGPGVTRGDGANAYETYADLAGALSRASVVVLEGRVLNGDRLPIPGASLDIAVGGGGPVPGCAVSQADDAGRFSVFAVGEGRSLSISVQARTPEADGVRETFDVNYFIRNASAFAERGGGVTARAESDVFVPGAEAPAVETVIEEEPVAPPPDVAAERAAACRVIDAAVMGARSELAAGLLDRLPEAQSRIDEAVGAEANLDACGPETAAAVAEAREMVAIAHQAFMSAESLLGQCELSALTAGRAALRPVSGINYDALTRRLDYAADGIRYFDEALSFYQDNLLGPAAEMLKSLPGLFGPDCQNYKERAEQGLQKIATLQQFDARLVAAIDACDIGRLEAMNAEIADRDHRYFAEARGRVAAALSSCGGQRAGETAALNCEAATAALNKARASYKANDLGQASSQLALAQGFLDPAASQLCPDIGPRIAQGNANIAALQQAEAELQAALASCDAGRLNTVRARATGETHAWFVAAIARVDDGLARCGTQVENQCEMLQTSFAAANEQFIAGNFDAVVVALEEMTARTARPESVAGCEDLAGRIPGAAAFVQKVMGMVGRAEAAIASCDAAEIEDALAIIQESGPNNVRVEEVKTRLVAAQDACRPPAVAPEPATTAELAPDTDEGAGALAILRDVVAKMKGGETGDQVLTSSAASGDHRTATVASVWESTNRTNDVPSSIVTMGIRITVTRYETDGEAAPSPQRGEEAVSDDLLLGFPYVISTGGDKGKRHAAIRFAKDRVRVEVVTDETGFTVLNKDGESDRGYAFAGVATVMLGKFIFENIDPDL
ncbi:MAG: hypothetical protein KDJ88_08045 [Bauldia sp.]|nr:hypothetical protein [Bauldia sp.]